MSGRKNKKPDDIVKARQEYIDNLEMEIYLEQQNEQAVRQYKETGQLPPVSQIKDNRTTEQKFKDVLGLKQSIVQELMPIADVQLATSIVNKLSSSPLNVDNRLLIFLAQRIQDLVLNLKKLYKYGISGSDDDAEQFVNLIYKYYNDNNNLTMTTKQFLSRLGTTQQQAGLLGMTSKINYQGTLLIRIGAEISSLTENLKSNLIKMSDSITIGNAEKVIDDFYFTDEEIEDIVLSEEDLTVDEVLQQRTKGILFPIIEKIQDIVVSISSLIQNLNIIYPKDPNFFDQIESTLLNIQGDPRYDIYARDISTYINYINHNLPNTDFVGGLMLSLKKSHDRIIGMIQNTLFSKSLILELTKYKDILTSIYEQLNTGEGPSELRKIRTIFENIIELIKYVGSAKSYLAAKKIGEEPRTYMTDPTTIPSDFGTAENYILIDDWPRYFDQDYNGVQKYLSAILIPLLNLVPNKKNKNKFSNELEQYVDELDIEKLIDLKKRIRKNLDTNKVSYSHLIYGMNATPEMSGDYLDLNEPDFGGDEFGYPYATFPTPTQNPAFGRRRPQDEEDEEDEEGEPAEGFVDDYPLPATTFESPPNPLYRGKKPESETIAETPSKEQYRQYFNTAPFKKQTEKKPKAELKAPEEKPRDIVAINKLIEDLKDDLSRKTVIDLNRGWRTRVNQIPEEKRKEFEELAKTKPLIGERYGILIDLLENYEKTGKGIRMKGRGFNKVIVEPKLGIQQDPRYIKFGRFLVNTKKLKDNVLSLRREKGTPLQNFPVYKMSRPFSNVIHKILGNGIPDENDFVDLTDEEKRYLHKVSKASDLSTKIKIPTPNKDEDEKDLHLFNVYKGEIMAGNDSKELITKFKALLNKLCKNNVLNKKEVDDLLSLF